LRLPGNTHKSAQHHKGTQAATQAHVHLANGCVGGRTM